MSDDFKQRFDQQVYGDTPSAAPTPAPTTAPATQEATPASSFDDFKSRFDQDVYANNPGITPRPAASTEMPNPATALYQGVRRGFTDVGQTAGGEDTEPESPAGAPYEWNDIWHPSSALSKTAYKIGQSSPTIATGVAGAGLGQAVAPGPVGAVVGGASGAALGAALQTYGPEFARELHKAPNDPEGAWSRAAQKTAVSAGASGASWALYPAKFLQGPLKNLAFQIFGVQPGINVGQQAARNVIEGEPVSKDLVSAYGQGVAGTAIPAAGQALGRAGQKPSTTKTKSEPLTSEDILAEGNNQFEKAHGLGGSNLGIAIDGRSVRDFVQQQAEQLRQEGFFPKLHGKDAHGALDQMMEELGTQGEVNTRQIDSIRKSLVHTVRSKGGTPEGTAAIHTISGLEDWLHNLQDKDVVYGKDFLPDYHRIIGEARQNWRVGRFLQTLEQLDEKAQNAKNPKTAMENNARKLLNNDLSNFTSEEQAQLRAVIKPGIIGQALNIAAKFSPHAGFGTLAMLGSLLEHSPHALLPVAAGTIASHITHGRTEKAMENVRQSVSARSPAGRAQPKPPTFGQRVFSQPQNMQIRPMPNSLQPDDQEYRRGGVTRKEIEESQRRIMRRSAPR